MLKPRDPETCKEVAKRVVRTFINEAHGTLLTLRFANGEEVTTTAGHPLYVEGKGFVLAGDLGIGTAIVTRAGPHAASKVVSIARHIGKSAAVYNFEVEDTHTYFVGQTDGGVWVHNDSGWKPNRTHLEDLARAKDGSHVVPDPGMKSVEHSVIGMKTEPKLSPAPYRQAMTYDAQGNPVGRTDASTHGRGDHVNPHFHPWNGTKISNPGVAIEPFFWP